MTSSSPAFLPVDKLVRPMIPQYRYFPPTLTDVPLAAAAGDSRRPSPQRLVVDTDPGVDDHMALLFLLGRKEDVIIEAITVVFGNHQSIDVLVRNVCRLLSLCGRTDIPVYVGCGKPMLGAFTGQVGQRIHGDIDAIGNQFDADEVIDMSMVQRHENAAHFLGRISRENPGEITLLTLGPLTNVASAILAENGQLPFQAMVVMGGAIDERGNKTPAAEANFHNDPHAAKIVCTAPPPPLKGEGKGEQKGGAACVVMLVHLKLTRQMPMTPSIKEALPPYILHGVEHYSAVVAALGGHDPVLHDPTAALVAVHPELFAGFMVPVDVEVAGELTMGMSIADFHQMWQHELPFCLVVDHVLDVERALAILAEGMSAAWKR